LPANLEWKRKLKELSGSAGNNNSSESTKIEDADNLWIIGDREVSKMTRIYTIREAIGELDAIRMDSTTIAKQQDKELAALVSELASVTGWLARHLDSLEAELVSDISFETEDGPIRKSEIFSGGTMDGENSHPGMKRR
jgi:hypothetical protein